MQFGTNPVFEHRIRGGSPWPRVSEIFTKKNRDVFPALLFLIHHKSKKNSSGAWESSKNLLPRSFRSNHVTHFLFRVTFLRAQNRGPKSEQFASFLLQAPTIFKIYDLFYSIVRFWCLGLPRSTEPRILVQSSLFPAHISNIYCARAVQNRFPMTQSETERKIKEKRRDRSKNEEEKQRTNMKTWKQ